MRWIVLAIAGFIFSGCKLITAVGEGGSLDSLSGSSDCAEFSTCEIEITVADFMETFTAVAKGGYVFSHWREGDNFG